MAMTFTYDEIAGQGIRKIIASWTSDGSGAAAGTTKKICGELIKGVTNPTDSPTDDYDLVITDSDSVNVLGNCFDDLQDRDTTNTEEVYFSLSNKAGTAVAMAAFPVVCSPLTLTISNAGDTKSGVATIYYRPYAPDRTA